MEFLTDWRFYAFIVTMIGLAVNWLATHKVATNHLAHLDEKIDNISNDVKSIDGKVNAITKDIAVLQEKTKAL